MARVVMEEEVPNFQEMPVLLAETAVVHAVND